MIVAKFKVNRFEMAQYPKQIDPAKGWGQDNLEIVEQRTIFASPVYGNGDPNHENTKFWNASPTGELRLGVINKEAWPEFELGQEYYVYFSKDKLQGV